jgi:hypothetical protein
MRVVSRFSCGAASAVATKLALDAHGDAVHIVNAFIADELDDNRRFLADCERWYGRTITVLRDTKHGASVARVWLAERFIASRHGASCSRLLKREVLDKYNEPGDLMVLGYTAEESDRLDNFIDANAGVNVWAPLIEAGLTKRDCFQAIASVGIELPLSYRLGYHNGNCLKCPRGGLGYWNKIRVDFPDNFEEVARVQDALGPGSWFLSDRRGGKRVRVSLRMLDPNAGRFSDEAPIECGSTCEWPNDNEHADVDDLDPQMELAV